MLMLSIYSFGKLLDCWYQWRNYIVAGWAMEIHKEIIQKLICVSMLDNFNYLSDCDKI